MIKAILTSLLDRELQEQSQDKGLQTTPLHTITPLTWVAHDLQTRPEDLDLHIELLEKQGFIEVIPDSNAEGTPFLALTTMGRSSILTDRRRDQSE